MVAVVAVGFDPSILEFDKLEIDLNDGGIMLLTKDEKNKIKSSCKNLAREEKDQYLSLLAYQFEFGYELALNPSVNVSRSLGVESFLGVFGGE